MPLAYGSVSLTLTVFKYTEEGVRVEGTGSEGRNICCAQEDLGSWVFPSITERPSQMMPLLTVKYVW